MIAVVEAVMITRSLNGAKDKGDFSITKYNKVSRSLNGAKDKGDFSITKYNKV